MPKLEVVSFDDLRPDLNLRSAGRIYLDRFEADDARTPGYLLW